MGQNRRYRGKSIWTSARLGVILGKYTSTNSWDGNQSLRFQILRTAIQYNKFLHLKVHPMKGKSLEYDIIWNKRLVEVSENENCSE